MFYRMAKCLVSVLSWVYFPISITGREHIASQGGFIIACNHHSYLDPVIMGSIMGRPISYMARESLFRNWLFARIMRALGAFPVNRNTADIRSLREAMRRIRNGIPVCVFPEGTRLATSREKGNPGIGFLAVKTGVPVIPVFIRGSDHVLPPGAKWFRRKRVDVLIGKPMWFTKSQNYTEIVHQIMQTVRALPTNAMRTL